MNTNVIVIPETCLQRTWLNTPITKIRQVTRVLQNLLKINIHTLLWFRTWNRKENISVENFLSRIHHGILRYALEVNVCASMNLTDLGRPGTATGWLQLCTQAQAGADICVRGVHVQVPARHLNIRALPLIEKKRWSYVCLPIKLVLFRYHMLVGYLVFLSIIN